MDELKKLNYIFTKKQKRESVYMLILIVIGSMLELIGVSAIMPLINAIMKPDRILESVACRKIYEFLHLQNASQMIFVLLLMLILIYILKNAYLVFMYKQQYRYIYSNMRALSTKMMQCYLYQPYLFHVEKNSAELLRNINQDTGDFFGTIQALVHLATEGLVVIVLIMYLFVKDRSITMGIGVVMLVMLWMFRKVYKKYLLKTGDTNRYYEAQVTKWVQQAFGGIKEVKVMNKEDFFYHKYDDAYAGRVKSEYTYHTMTSIPKPVIEAACMVGLLGSVAIKIIRGVHPEYFVPTMSIFAVAAYRLLPSFNRITEYLGTITYQKPAIDAIYKDLKEIEDLNKTRGMRERNVDSERLPFRHAITIKDLTFHYPNTHRLVLDHVDMVIDKNTSVAFIGQSGAGKTTLADLILGVLVPSGGCVLADDADIQKHLNEWHRTIGYIPQNIYLMDDTIRANIAFGIPDDQIDEIKLNNAVKRAQLSDVISELPQGLNTMVGERGIRFSGGQRQRIGIARALYNEPDVLVLDEATSALDNETEAAVMESIDALHGEMTLIIIAHRLSTTQNCDHIFEIGKGGVIRKR